MTRGPRRMYVVYIRGPGFWYRRIVVGEYDYDRAYSLLPQDHGIIKIQRLARLWPREQGSVLRIEVAGESYLENV
jgi:hypothetical protein